MLVQLWRCLSEKVTPKLLNGLGYNLTHIISSGYGITYNLLFIQKKNVRSCVPKLVHKSQCYITKIRTIQIRQKKMNKTQSQQDLNITLARYNNKHNKTSSCTTKCVWRYKLRRNSSSCAVLSSVGQTASTDSINSWIDVRGLAKWLIWQQAQKSK